MRIPPWVIVMSLVTAVPFGFAVRASILHRDGTVDEAARARAEAEQRLRDDEAQELREAQLRDEQKAIQRKRIAQLFGPSPATLGSLFDGFALGALESADHRSIDAFIKELEAEVRYEWEGALTRIHILSAETDVCSAMSDQLSATWHDPTASENINEAIWLDPSAHQRVVFRLEDRGCWIDVTNYVPVERWFDRSQASIVPMWAVGQRVDRLELALDGHAHSSEPDSIEWVAPGVGTGTSVTRLTAEIEDGRVVAVTAWSMITSATGADLARHFATVLGGEPIDTGSKQTWSSRPPVTLTFENGVSVRIGRAPKDEPHEVDL